MPLSALPGQCPGFEAVLFPAQISPFPGPSLPSCSLARSHCLPSALAKTARAVWGRPASWGLQQGWGSGKGRLRPRQEGRWGSVELLERGVREPGGLGGPPRKEMTGKGQGTEWDENTSLPRRLLGLLTPTPEDIRALAVLDSRTARCVLALDPCLCPDQTPLIL